MNVSDIVQIKGENVTEAGRFRASGKGDGQLEREREAEREEEGGKKGTARERKRERRGDEYWLGCHP